MNYSTHVIAFKSHVKSAMNDDVSWDMLDLMLDNLCINVKVSKEVIHVLLEELKLYKFTKPSDSVTKSEIVSTDFAINDKNEIKEELNGSNNIDNNTLVHVKVEVADEEFYDEVPDNFDEYEDDDKFYEDDMEYNPDDENDADYKPTDR